MTPGTYAFRVGAFTGTAVVREPEWVGARDAVVVTVRPRVDVRVRRGLLRVGVRPSASFAGRPAAVQRATPDGAWRHVRGYGSPTTAGVRVR